MKEPKKKIEIVFYLIQRMSSAEKRYFRLSSQIYRGKDTGFMKLFDLLNEMKEYDVAIVKAFWKKEKIRQKNVCVTYLLDKVTETMYSIGNNELLVVKNLIQPHLNTFHVYYRLQLFKLAYKELNKAELIAEKYDVSNSILFEIYEFKFHMVKITNFNENICESEVAIEEKSSKALQKFIHIKELTKILFKIYKGQSTKLEIAYQELKTYERHYNELPILGKMLFNDCQYLFEKKRRNKTQSIAFIQSNINLHENNPHIIPQLIRDYLVTWHNRLISGLPPEHIDQALEYRERYKQLPQIHKEIFDNLPVNAKLSYQLSGLQFDVMYTIRYEQYYQVEQITQRARHIFENNYAFSMSGHNVHTILLRVAYCNLLIKNYIESEYWIGRLLNISCTDALIAEEAEIIELLLIYEQGNKSLMSSNLKRLRRKWKIMPPTSSNVLHMIDLFQKIQQKRYENKYSKLFEIAQANACQIEISATCYIPFSRWIALKMRGCCQLT